MREANQNKMIFPCIKWRMRSKTAICHSKFGLESGPELPWWQVCKDVRGSRWAIPRLLGQLIIEKVMEVSIMLTYTKLLFRYEWNCFDVIFPLYWRLTLIQWVAKGPIEMIRIKLTLKSGTTIRDTSCSFLCDIIEWTGCFLNKQQHGNICSWIVNKV